MDQRTLHARELDDIALIGRLERRLADLGFGQWRVIDAETAFQDPVFASEPDVLPAGESIIWALAKESGKHTGVLRYPAEDEAYERGRMDELGL